MASVTSATQPSAALPEGEEVSVAAFLEQHLNLFPIRPTSLAPASLTSYLFLGSGQHGKDVGLLKTLAVTCVINCAENEVGTHHYDQLRREGIHVVGFPSDDAPTYNMAQHLDVVLEVVQRVKDAGSRCLIHCSAGVNRSGFLAIALLCELEKMPLVQAATHARRERGRVCTNKGFQKQLLATAKARTWLLS